MRKVCLWAVLVGISIAMPLAAQVGKSPVVMTINDQPVYSWEIGLLIPQVQNELAGRGVPPKRDEVINTALQRIVDSRLLAQEARKRDLKPDGGRVQADLAQIEARAGGRAGLETVLGNLGASYDQLRASVSEKDLVEVFITTQIKPQITVKAEDVKAFFIANPEMFARPDMVRARHILIRLTPSSTAAETKEARDRAKAAHRRVVAGEDFALVARQGSEGREASQGGDMGFFAQDSMMPALTNVAFVLEVGQISDIIETQFGFHILKLEEKRPASQMTFEEAEVPVQQLLEDNQAAEKVNEVLAKLKETANVVMMTPPGAASANPDGG